MKPQLAYYRVYSNLDSKIVGKSPQTRELIERIKIIGPTKAPVVIYGETGAGKELVARRLHFESGRREGLLVPINCPALPSGTAESELFGHEEGAYTNASEARIGQIEIANRGTVFLDEITSLPLGLQAKLLRTLQLGEINPVGGYARRVDVRFIAATSGVLEDEVAKGNFRRDLYHRLNVVTIEVPPLRERREDIPLLVEHFLEKYCKIEGRSLQVSPDALDTLMEYNWAGNVRELENLVYQAVILRGAQNSDGPPPTLNKNDLYSSFGQNKDTSSSIRPERGIVLSEIMKILETGSFEQARHYFCEFRVRQEGGNQVVAAKSLGINRNTLRKYLRKMPLGNPK